MKERHAYYEVQNWESIDNNERGLIKKKLKIFVVPKKELFYFLKWKQGKEKLQMLM